MISRVSSSKLKFGDIARGVDSGVSLSFSVSKPFEKSLSEQVILIGQSVQNFAQSLPESSGVRAGLLDLIPSKEPSAKGWSGSSFLKLDGKGVRTHVFMTPTESSRHNSSFRSDSVVKSLLSQLSDSISEVSKSDSAVKRVDVVCALPSLAAVPSTCFAIARSLPRFTRKTDRGKDLDASKPSVEVSVSFFLQSGELLDAEKLRQIEIIADSIRMSQSLSDTPPNELNVTTYVEFVQSLVADLSGVDINIIRGSDLETQGFGGLWNVGKGNTTNLPALVVLSHGASPGVSGVSLVGKGIVYDSGGLSIKGGANMCAMKYDMTGSAAMLSSFVALVRMGGIGKPLHCVLCLAENSVGPDSFRNDDIIRLYSGMTVEINNTDAEGRLVLADGAAYAVKHLQPDLVIDMATLTGAQGVATGTHHGAVLSAFEDEETGLVAAGKISGDLTFPILFCPEFHRTNYKSECADMKNSLTNRADATSSASGWFVYDHMNAAGYSGKWAHIDMASPATLNPSGRGSGYGVGLICTFLNKKAFTV